MVSRCHGVIFSVGNTCGGMSKCSVTMVEIDGRKSEFIVDTGSQVSLIPINMVIRLKLKLRNRDDSIVLRTANGSELDTLGSVNVTVKLWNKVCEQVKMIVTNQEKCVL